MLLLRARSHGVNCHVGQPDQGCVDVEGHPFRVDMPGHAPFDEFTRLPKQRVAASPTLGSDPARYLELAQHFAPRRVRCSPIDQPVPQMPDTFARTALRWM